jgi:hypothetical protein
MFLKNQKIYSYKKEIKSVLSLNREKKIYQAYIELLNNIFSTQVSPKEKTISIPTRVEKNGAFSFERLPLPSSLWPKAGWVPVRERKPADLWPASGQRKAVFLPQRQGGRKPDGERVYVPSFPRKVATTLPQGPSAKGHGEEGNLPSTYMSKTDAHGFFFESMERKEKNSAFSFLSFGRVGEKKPVNGASGMKEGNDNSKEVSKGRDATLKSYLYKHIYKEKSVPFAFARKGRSLDYQEIDRIATSSKIMKSKVFNDNFLSLSETRPLPGKDQTLAKGLWPKESMKLVSNIGPKALLPSLFDDPSLRPLFASGQNTFPLPGQREKNNNVGRKRKSLINYINLNLSFFPEGRLPLPSSLWPKAGWVPVRERKRKPDGEKKPERKKLTINIPLKLLLKFLICGELQRKVETQIDLPPNRPREAIKLKNDSNRRMKIKKLDRKEKAYFLLIKNYKYPIALDQEMIFGLLFKMGNKPNAKNKNIIVVSNKSDGSTIEKERRFFWPVSNQNLTESGTTSHSASRKENVGKGKGRLPAGGEFLANGWKVTGNEDEKSTITYSNLIDQLTFQSFYKDLQNAFSQFLVKPVGAASFLSGQPKEGNQPLAKGRVGENFASGKGKARRKEKEHKNELSPSGEKPQGGRKNQFLYLPCNFTSNFVIIKEFLNKKLYLSGKGINKFTRQGKYTNKGYKLEKVLTINSNHIGLKLGEFFNTRKSNTPLGKKKLSVKGNKK